MAVGVPSAAAPTGPIENLRDIKKMHDRLVKILAQGDEIIKIALPEHLTPLRFYNLLTRA